MNIRSHKQTKKLSEGTVPAPVFVDVMTLVKMSVEVTQAWLTTRDPPTDRNIRYRRYSAKYYDYSLSKCRLTTPSDIMSGTQQIGHFYGIGSDYCQKWAILQYWNYGRTVKFWCVVSTNSIFITT